jgi:hypothetical protein
VDVWANNGELANSEVLADLVRNSKSSVGTGSDSSSSGVREPVLVSSVGVESLDSESVLSSSDWSLVVNQNSVLWESRSDDEFDVVSQWESWCVSSSGVKGPELVVAIVAVPPSNLLVHSVVVSSPDVKALASCELDVLSFSWEVSELLVSLVSEWSDDSPLSNSVSSSVLVGDGVVSLFVPSDRFSSGIIDPPKSVIPGWASSDSESISVGDSGCLVSEEGSSAVVDSDSELLSSLVWELWLNSGAGVESPSLVESVVALPPDEMLVLTISISGDIKAPFVSVSDSSSRSIDSDDLVLVIVIILSS